MSENELSAKMEIVYYLCKKERIYFDKTVVLKTEIARMFIDYMKIDVDKDLVLTACLLCNCKKITNSQDLDKIKSFATEGANYLAKLGFDKKFCKICQEVNRYSGNDPREKESDILEVVDQFGGMILDRPERKGFEIDEALMLMEERNLKNINNRYFELFKDFINFIEDLKYQEEVSTTPIKKLRKFFYESKDLATYIREVTQKYGTKVDKLVYLRNVEIVKNMMEKNADPNRSLFSIDTINKLVGQANLSED